MKDLSQRIASLPPDQLQRFLSEFGQRTRTQPGEEPIRPRPRDSAGPPLSFPQQRLWFLDQIEPGTPVYNMAALLEMSGRLEVPVLAAALREIVRRHESLRTTFTAVDGRPLQVVSNTLMPGLPLFDLTALPEDARREEVRRLAVKAAHFSFALDRGPLLSTWLVRQSGELHALLLTFHHIVSDGWSTAVFMREVAALYEALAAGRPAPLAQLEIQYPDFALWQRQRLRGELLEHLTSYWREQLAGVPVLELPTDHPRPSVQSHRGANYRWEIPAGSTAAARSLGSAEGVTLFMVLLATFDALLFRYTGQDDLCVGTFIANRNRVQVENLIGFFVNNLALRVRLDRGGSLRELLVRVRETTTAAHAHQDLPFEALLEAIQPERSLSHTPIFQVVLVFQNTPRMQLELPGLTLRRVDLGADWSNFDLTLWIEEGEALAVRLEYAQDLFEPVTMERLASHFLILLAGAVADPARRLAELPLLTAPEREQLLVRWARWGAPFPTDGLVHQLFARAVAAAPEAPALVGDERSLTYAELDSEAEGLARRLAARGVGPEAVVGVCVDPPSRVVAPLLAVLKAGGAFLPLDPVHPPERLDFMLANAGARIVVTQTSLADQLPGSIPRLLLDAGPKPAAGEDVAAGVPPVPENLAYVIYTSGSTGRPKGVAVTHRNLLPMMLWSLEYFWLGPHTRVLQNLSYCFDFGIFELLTTLFAGGTLYFLDGARGDFDRHAAAIEEWRINTIHSTPSFFREIAAAGARLGSLEVVHLGGEALPRDLTGRIFSVTGEECRLLNGYGPTEATVNSTIYEVRRGGREGGDFGGVPIGRATANNEVYVLDGAGEAVPIGVHGELHVGGDGVARGYLGEAALTAKKFVPDPFGRPGGRLYRTGDRVRYTLDGQVEFLGRIDQQVKIRGYRIELEEIEAVLCAHAGIAAAVAAVQEGGAGGQRLVAYVVAATAPPPSAAELRSLAERFLPAYMVPSAFVFLDSLPLTTNGKVDRRQLPDPESLRPELGQAFVAPRTPTEEVLAGIWAEVLGVERTGVLDGFFDLGGHSLLATQIVSRVRDTLGVELPLHLFFEALTVAEQAARIDEARQPEVPPILPVPRASDLPVSFAQERVWFLEQLDPDLVAYYVPRALRIHGRIDAERLAGAYTELTRRHEVLRTTFPSVDGRPVQRIRPPAPFRLPVLDLSGLPAGAREAEIARLCLAEGRRRFALDRDFPLRATLVRLGVSEHLLLQTEHHLAHDGWALGVLLRDLLELYDALGSRRPPSLPPLPVQYADFAVWQRSWLTDEVLARQLAFWTDLLAGAPPLLTLPADHPRPPQQSFRGAERIEEIPHPAAEVIRGLARREGVTLFMAMLAGFSTLLSRMSGAEDLVLGSGVANRRRPECEGMMGMMINTLVLRLDLTGDPSFRELLRRVRALALAAYAHQDLPFESLVRALRPKRSSSHSPIFQVVFAFNDAPTPEIEIPGLRIEEVVSHNRSAKFDLLLIASPHAEQRTSAVSRTRASAINLALEYSQDLFDATTVARLLGQYQRLLAAAAVEPELPISRLPFLSAAERRQLLGEWSGTAMPQPPWRSLPALVAEVAARDPEGLAAVSRHERLTYRELLGRVGHLASELRRLGVGPEVKVGVTVGTSLELPVSFLAVLVAGGVYVPLDSMAPPERLEWMVSEAGVKLLLSRGGAAVPDRPGLRYLDPRTAWETAPLEADGLRDDGTGPDTLAYLIYTSGSTGRPKGVMVPHQALVSRAETARRLFALGTGSRLLQLAPSTFDASVFEMTVALGSGAALALEDLETGPGLSTVLRDLAVTHVVVPPSVLAVAGQEDLPDLQAVLFAGEALPPWMVARWGQGRKIFDLYGPTETTIWSTVARCLPDEARPSIGHPIDGARVLVLDRWLEPVPAGVAGELCIGGTGLARGYLGRPGLTAERFVPDPGGDEPGARIYRSGDLARHLQDGRLDFLGRIDHQIKVHGVRIEPGEIEAALTAHSGVREAVVIASGEAEERRLTAFLVPTGEPPDPAKLRAWLLARLPVALVPTVFISLESLPLTRHGKINRGTLLQTAAQRSMQEAGYVAPATEIETALAAIWREVLNLERVGGNDDFFDLGGHSLLATRVVTRIRGELGVNVPVRQFYDAPALGQLARFVEESLFARIEADRLEQELQELEALSDDEIAALLAEDATGRSPQEAESR